MHTQCAAYEMMKTVPLAPQESQPTPALVLTSTMLAIHIVMQITMT